MSYYIHKTAATKEQARAEVLHEFVTVTVAGQPIHERDRAAAVANMDAALALLTPPADSDVSLILSGSLGWPAGVDPATCPLTSVAISVNAYSVRRLTE